jgi:hypothetical protein
VCSQLNQPPQLAPPVALENLFDDSFSKSGRQTTRMRETDGLVARRFPPPWSVEEQDTSFVVKDSGGQGAYFESADVV